MEQTVCLPSVRKINAFHGRCAGLPVTQVGLKGLRPFTLAKVWQLLLIKTDALQQADTQQGKLRHPLLL